MQVRTELTPDGIVCPDLTVSLLIAPSLRFALELVSGGRQREGIGEGKVHGRQARLHWV